MSQRALTPVVLFAFAILLALTVPLWILGDFRADLGVGTLSLLLLIGIFALLVAGVPLGFATGFLGAIIIWLNFGEPGLGLVMQRVYDLVVTHAIIAVPFFIIMASLLERSGIAKDMYDALNLAMGRMRGGVAIVTTVMAVIMAAMSGIIGGEIVLLGLVALPADAAPRLQQASRHRHDLRRRLARHDDSALGGADHLRPGHRNLDHQAVHRVLHTRADAGGPPTSSTS